MRLQIGYSQERNRGSHQLPVSAAAAQREQAADVAYIRKAVGKATAKGYDRMYLHYDAFLQHPISRDVRRTGSFYTPSEQSRLIVRYIRYLDEVLGLPHTQRAKAIAALQFAMRNDGESLGVFDEAAVRAARKAGRPGARELSLARERKKRMPVTMDMLRWMREKHWESHRGVAYLTQGRLSYAEWRRRVCNGLDARMTYVAITLAYVFLWRVSQYTAQGKNSGRTDHNLMAEDVLFKLRGTAPANHRAHRFPWQLRGLSPTTVESALLVIRSSKSDVAGRGQYLHLARRTSDEATFLETLVIQCQESGVRPGDPLFISYRFGTSKRLNSRMINEALHDTAVDLGFGELGFAFSSHGLRIGGATELRASGRSSEEIRILGGWAPGSRAVHIYELDSDRLPNTLTAATTSDRRGLLEAAEPPPAEFCPMIDEAAVWNMVPPALRRHLGRRL